MQDVCELVRGSEPGSQNYNMNGKGYKFIRVSDISKGRTQNLFTLADNIVLCQKDDILVAFDGSPGIVATNFEGAISSGIRIIKPKIQILLREFLYWVLQSNYVQDVIKEYSFGATILHASKSIPYIKIPIPNLTIQFKISTELKEKMSEVEKLRISIENQLEAINALPQAILRKAFRGEL